MIRQNRGYTLVELIVTMLIFVFVIMLTGNAFNSIAKYSTKLMRSEESNIEGIIGLELFRGDLEKVGFGLAQSFSQPITYTEAMFAPANDLSLNDAPNGIPRAIAVGNNVVNLVDNNPSDSSNYNVVNGTDYLVLKGVSLGSATSRRWSYLNYSGTQTTPNLKAAPKNWSQDNIPDGATVIMLSNSYTDSGVTNQLVAETSTKFSVAFNKNGFDDAVFRPSSIQEIYYIYAVDDSGAATLGMPFNRIDYLVARPSTSSKIPGVCAPNTGMLYRATVNQSGGKLTYQPILDCIADMQVVFGWDMDGDAYHAIDTYSSAKNMADDSIVVSGFGSSTDVAKALKDPAEIRNRLKMIKVYILAQNGRRDPGYTSPTSIVIGDEDNGETSLTKTYNLSADMLNYRWKVYRIVVRPKNLLSNY